ncbi:ATP-binding protein [Liquorilactobacillus hordei]|uniref:ATP-binding protein n=1 Tax=Liquorilactobacillus hordei TaxID=468911 RepID=UPI0039E74961
MFSTKDIDVYSYSKFEKCGTCPRCGAEMLRYKRIIKSLGHKVGGACPMCKYTENTSDVKKRAETEEDFTLAARKNKAIGYMNKYSIYATAKIFNNRFSNFEISTVEQRKIYDTTRKLANEMASKPLHVLLLGSTGRGKTHIATAMMYQIQEKTDYGKKVIFYHFPALIADIKKGMGQEDIRKKIDESLEEMKIADLVVIDDLGAERDSDFTVSIIEDIMQYCEDKSMIVTTNLTGTELIEKYKDRFMSRLGKNGNSIVFKNIADHRR